MIKQVVKRTLRAVQNGNLRSRALANMEPARAFGRAGQALNAEEQCILDDLNRDGIAITSAEALFEDAALYTELESAALDLQEMKREDLAAAREGAEIPGQKKTFLVQLLGDCPQLDPKSIWVRLAVDPSVLRIANSYFGLYTQLRAFNLWHTFAMKGAPRRSQLWHRDPEDKLILKMFVYLNDVDEGAGPFIYARGTHPKGSVKQQPEQHKEEGASAWRATDEAMSRVVPEKDWITATGRRGTIIFADTRGYHKGGLARTTDRLMFNSLYVSPGSNAREMFSRQPTDANGLDESQRRALRIETK